MILCCDTATDYAALAVCDDNGAILASATLRRRRDLSVRLLADIDAVLAAAGTTFEAIDTLATGLGPGSFTGVRVAVTTFRTLAQATGKRLVGIDTLSLYARAASEALGTYAVVPFLPSRRGEVYAAVYEAGACIRPAFAATFAELNCVLGEMRGEREVLLVGPAGVLPEDFAAYPMMREDAPSAEAFAMLAAAALRAGDLADPMGLNPLYVVPPAINQHKDPRTALRLSGLA